MEFKFKIKEVSLEVNIVIEIVDEKKKTLNRERNNGALNFRIK